MEEPRAHKRKVFELP